MNEPFRLLMIGAMYENGGNTTHRLLDGHPQLLVYPFESQIGTPMVRDHLASMFPLKYRWPVFDLDARPDQDYEAIIDEETRVRARTPHVSKFRHVEFHFSDEERKRLYVELISHLGRARPKNVEAFFRATFEAWHNRARGSDERMYVGYSPIITVDADKILDDLPHAHVVHVVRNPWSAYADTRKRPVPLSIAHYMLAWTLTQQSALFFQQRYPGRLHIVRVEDVMADPQHTLGEVCTRLGLESAPSLANPSWNGAPLTEVYPWGTIRIATPAANRATAAELSDAECDEVRQRAAPYLDMLDYSGFM